MCVAPDRRAAEAGASILSQGGNAFDAAVAAGFMEAVVSPQNCGIGGYAATGIGYLAADHRTVALDADAVAPHAATPDMFPVVVGADPNDFRLASPTTSKGRSRSPFRACSAAC